MWTSAGAPLRQAIFHLLSAPELKGKLCSFERLIAPLNMLGGGIGLGEYAEVDHALITLAFSRRGEEFTHPFSQMKMPKAGKSIMLCRLRLRTSRGIPVYKLGRFDPLVEDDSDIHMGDTYPTPRSHDSMADHPLDRPG